MNIQIFDHLLLLLMLDGALAISIGAYGPESTTTDTYRKVGVTNWKINDNVIA